MYNETLNRVNRVEIIGSLHMRIKEQEWFAGLSNTCSDAFDCATQQDVS